MEKITIYTDGAVSGNGEKDSKCGWACKLIYHGKSIIKSGHCRGKTNNQMEMLAVLNALKSIKDNTIPTEIYSDSQYVVRTLNGEYQVGKNEGLWNELFREYKKFSDIKVIWVKGHANNPHNLEVDNAAVREAKNA